MRIALPLLIIALAGCSGDKPPEATKQLPVAPPQTLDPAGGLTEPRPISVPGVLLRMKFKEGQIYRRILNGVMTVAAVPGKPAPPKTALQTTSMMMRYQTTVLNVKAGTASVKVHTSGLEVVKKDTEGKWVPPKHASNILIDERGLVRNDMEGLVSGVTGIGLIPFPKERVAYGSYWSRDTERDMAPLGPVKITETYTYRGVLTENKIPLYKIEFKGMGTVPDLVMQGNFYYRQSDGSLYRGELYQSATIEVPSTEQSAGGGFARISLRVVVKCV